MRRNSGHRCGFAVASAMLAATVGSTAGVAQSDRWSGAYGGFLAGYAFPGNIDEVGVRNFKTDAFINNYGPLGPRGAFGGAQIGYNAYSQGVLLGIEGDYAFGRISASSNVTASGLNVASHSQLNSFGTLRARIGTQVAPAMLLYATGGLAFGKYDYTVAYAGTLNGRLARSDSSFGWTAGAGAEWAIDRHWSLKAEYLFLGLMPKHAVNDGKISTIEHLYQSNVRLGINYKF